MIQASILIYLNFSQAFILYTDASYIDFKYILAQKKEGKEYLITYRNQRTMNAEKNYSVTDLKGAALVWTIEKNKHYFNTVTLVTIVTDHKALTTWFTQNLLKNKCWTR